MARVRADYADFAPTLASEKLSERDGLAVSREKLRQWMIEDGLWQVRQRRGRPHVWRPRRSCCGELVQMDTSEHAWFEGRGPVEPVLITMIDDATSRVLSRFYEGDTTLANLDMVGRYVRRYGRAMGVYADRNSLFKTTRPTTAKEALQGKDPETQVSRALRELDMPYIPAYTPWAWDTWNSLGATPKPGKVINIADGGRQRAVIWEMSGNHDSLRLGGSPDPPRKCLRCHNGKDGL